MNLPASARYEPRPADASTSARSLVTTANREEIAIMTDVNHTTITRRAALAGLVTAPAVAIPGAAAVTEELQTVATPIKVWSDFIASFADLTPDGARVNISGGQNSCRVEFLQTFMEPLRPGRLGRVIPVEWIVASYRLTPNGWESEGQYPVFREGIVRRTA
jgi:hypothetical protein